MIVEVSYGSGYFVDESGVVYSSKRGTIKPLKPLTAGHNGYSKVRLYDSNANGRKWKSFFVHRLVAEAFVPNPSNHPVVNHKDENPRNNNASNLEWCTVKYNNVYGSALQKKSESMKRRFELNPQERERVRAQSKNRVLSDEAKAKIATTLSKPVEALSGGKVVAMFRSAKEAEVATGIRRGNICKALKGGRKFAGGYQWRYAACGGEIEGKNVGSP